MVETWLAVVFVAAFIALVTGILIWLHAANRKLTLLSESARSMQQSTTELAVKLGELADPAAETVRTLQRQIDSTARLFEAARRVGETADQASAAFRSVTRSLTAQAQAQVERGGGKFKQHIQEALDWAEVGYAAWNFVQAKRKDERPSECCQRENGHDTKE